MERGVYVGRFSPLHAGHECVIELMRRTHGDENCLLIIGSSNQERTIRHFFSYSERRSLIQTIYPSLKIIGIPDYMNDAEWLLALEDHLELGGTKIHEATFYGGCEEDILFFLKANLKYQILNRFDGSTPKISATEIRDCLLHGRPLEGKVNPKIEPQLTEMFCKNWEEFRRR